MVGLVVLAAYYQCNILTLYYLYDTICVSHRKACTTCQERICEGEAYKIDNWTLRTYSRAHVANTRVEGWRLFVARPRLLHHHHHHHRINCTASIVLTKTIRKGRQFLSRTRRLEEMLPTEVDSRAIASTAHRKFFSGMTSEERSADVVKHHVGDWSRKVST